MAEDFQLLFLKKNSPVRNYDRSTGLYNLSKEELEDLGPSDTSRNLMCSHENHSDTWHKTEIEETVESPSRCCETPEVDRIPESVRELLNILVKRASRNQNEDVSNEEDPQSSVDTNEINRTDESWTSSMATPSKDNSVANDINDSTLINFKFETSDLEVVSADKSTEKNMINIDHNEDVNITEDDRNRPFHVFDAPCFDTNMKKASNLLHEKEDLCSESEVNESSMNGLENLLLLSATASMQDKIIQPVEIATFSELPRNSCFETLMNSTVADDSVLENESNFLMSTPVKEYSVMNITNSFLSPGAMNICSKDLENVIVEKQDNDVVEFLDMNDDSIFEKIDHSLKFKDFDFNSPGQDILHEMSGKDSICDTGLMETEIINENVTTVEPMPSCDEKTIIDTGLIETVMIDENCSKILCMSPTNEKTFCDTDQMATVIIDENNSKINMSPVDEKSISGTDLMATAILIEKDSKFLCLSPINKKTFFDTPMLIGTNNSNMLCLSPVNEKNTCGTDQLEIMVKSKSHSTAICMLTINEQSICGTDQLETIALNESDTTAVCMSPINDKNICGRDQMETNIINEGDSTAICMTLVNGKSICVTDQMGTMVVDKSDSTAICMSCADEMDTVDMNEHDSTAVCMSVNEQEELTRVTDERNLHVEAAEESEDTRKEPEYVTQVLDILCSPVMRRENRRQNCVKGKKRKSTESPEADNFVKSKKLHHENELGNYAKESGTAIVDETLSTEGTETTVICIGRSEQRMTEVRSELREIPIIDRCKILIEKDQTMLKCDKNGCYDEQLRVNEELHRSSQLAKTEVVDRFIKQSKENAVSEEMINCNLNSSLADNFFSETVIFDCDRIINQCQVERTDNSSMANSAEVFTEIGASTISASQIKKEMETTDEFTTSSVDDFVIQMKPEDESQLHLNLCYSQDYLSCSVLEEVCKATEALAYCGKGKNECMMDGMDYESKIKIFHDSSLDIEIEENPVSTAGIQVDCTRESVKKITKDVVGCDSDGIIPSSSLDLYACQSDKLAVNIESDDERRIIPEEQDSKQNLRKKLHFTIPESITLDDDIESWEIDFTAENEVKESTQDKNSSFIAPPVQVQTNPQLLDKIEPHSSKRDCVPVFKAQKDIKKFVYPKHGKKFDMLISHRVKPEDLMASAVALEKCSNVLHNGKKSDMEQLKSKSLVCFNNLKINTDDKTVQVNVDSTSLKNEIISHNKLEYMDSKISSGSKSLVTDQLSDDSEELSYLLEAAKEAEKLVSEEAINNREHFLKGTVIECQEVSLRDVSPEKGPHVNVNMLNAKVEEIQKDIEIYDDSDRCVSPILRRRVTVKKSFKKNDKNSCQKPVGIPKLNEDKIEKSLNKTDIISSKNTISVSEGNILGFSIDSDKKELGYQNSHLQTKKLQLEDFTTEMENSVFTDIGKKLGKPELSIEQQKNMFLEKSTPARSGPMEFSTVSGKKVPDSEKSMLQARKTFSEEPIKVTEGDFIENVTDSGRESLVPVITSNKVKDSLTPSRSIDLFGCSTTIEKKVGVSEKSLLEVKKLFLEESTPSRENLAGFSTASGKKVSVSEKALLRAKNIFSEEGTSTPTRGTDSFGFSTASGRKVDVSEKSLVEARKLFLEESTPSGTNSMGFAAVSGSKLSVSEKALLMAKNIFSEERTSAIEAESPISSRGNLNNLPTHKKSSLQHRKFSLEDTSTPTRGTDSFGFSTASGRKVDVSEKSLVEARKLFLEESTPSGTNSMGFAAVSGSKSSVSEKALLMAKNIFSEERTSAIEAESPISSRGNLNNLPTHKKSSLQHRKFSLEDTSTPTRGTDSFGFSTASGRKVDVSEKSLVEARKLFLEEDTSTPTRGTDSFGFSTASGRKVDVSEKSLVEARKLFLEESTPSGTNSMGFAAVSGSKSSVSEKALLMAKNIFSEERTSAIEAESPISSRGNLNNLPTHKKSSLQHRKFSLEDTSTPTRGTDSFGFSTASGRKVDVSEKSLVEARKLFLEESTPSGTNSMGFAAVSGSKSSVSEKALLMAKNIFSEERTSAIEAESPISSRGNLNNLPTHKKSSLQHRKFSLEDTSTPTRGTGSFGFSTASGRKADVSEKSLLEDKKPFLEESTPATNPGGFSTASRKKLPVSDKALLKDKTLFSEEAIPIIDVESIELVSDSGRKASFPEKTSSLSKKVSLEESFTPTRGTNSFGFSTASGTKVDISEKSVLKAKGLFLEESTPSGTNSMGFAKASGKKVSVSEKAMLQAKKLFSEKPILIVDEEYTENSSVSERKASTPSKSSDPAKKISFEDSSTPPILIVDEEYTENSSVSGRKASTPSKSSDPAKKILFEDSSAPARRTDLFAFATASEKKVVISEKSIMQGKKLFLEDSTPRSIGQPIPGLGVTLPARRRIPASGKSVTKTNRPYLGHNFPSVINVSVDILMSSKENNFTIVEENVNKLSENRPSCPSPLKGEILKGNIGASTSMDQIHRIEKQNLNVTQDFHFAESQGDNYIKAVDLALLNSPYSISTDQGPPSPVFKIRNRRRRFRNAHYHGKIDVVKQDLKNSSIEKHDEDTRSNISTLSSCPLTQKNEVAIKEKELWDRDLAEETWWGKHCDLAEACNTLENISQELDIWAEARKRQEEVIISKKNVRPIIGRHFQERKSRGTLHRSSLRELVRRKRPGRYSKDELRKFNVRESTANVTSSNAAKFQFQLKDYYSNNPDGMPIDDGIILIPDQKGMFGAAEAQATLLAAPGVDPSLLPPGGWCENHYRWIVWKLASSERSFPEELGGRYLKPENVVRQLKYRWDREVDCGERPALRKILEMDDIASKRMVLCISSIEKPVSITASKKLELDLMANSIKLELTDGWYAIHGAIDTEMAALIQNGKLAVGTKIVTSGAELINSPSNGCHPLEPAASKAAIRLSTNSTRRAHWDSKLGYVCRNPGPLPVTLRSLLPGGGTVGALRNVILARTYPILNVEKTPGGRKVVRSQKAEARIAANYERQRQIWLENIYSQVSAEIQKEEEAKTRSQRKRARSWQAVGNRNAKHPKRNLSLDESRWEPGKSPLPLSGSTSPEELFKMLEESEDPSSFQSILTSSQLNQLTAYRQEVRERQQRELEDRVRQRIKQEEDKLLTPSKSGTPVTDEKHLVGKIKRDVVALFKVRIVDADRPVASKSAVLTIWRPSEEVVSLFSKEGSILTIYGFTTNGIRSGFLQLSTNRQTRYKLNHRLSQHAVHPLDRYPSLQRVTLFRGFDDYSSQQGSGLGSPSSHLPPFGEIDLVAMVIRIGDDPNIEKSQGYQNIFVAGSDGTLMSISFWGGIQEFAVDDILLPGVIVVATNLQWRRHHGLSRLPTVHAVDTSTFTRHPSEERLKIALKNFQNELKAEMQLEGNDMEFIHSCEQKLDAIAGVSEKDKEKPKTLAKASFFAKSSSSLKMANENLTPITPSVAARMKKLQMYEGAPEVSLPVCHIKKSAAVMKAFQPPVRGVAPKSCDSENKMSKVLSADDDSSPMSLDSDHS